MSTSKHQPTITGHRGYLGANAPKGTRWQPVSRKLKAGSHGKWRPSPRMPDGALVRLALEMLGV